MNIGLIGYGKMGREIDAIAQERGHSITARLTSQSSPSDWDQLKEADVCIEFSRPEAAIDNFRHCFENGIPLVTGTTGWYDRFEEVKELCTQKNGAFFWASNFSIGVNLFWQVNTQLAQLMAGYPEYNVTLQEIHHTQKLDAPSGTAITTAEQIIDQREELNGWSLSTEPDDTSKLSIEAIREGDVKGTHTVRYESAIDSIELTHAAKNRKGFAIGAVLAAEYLKDKTGVFTMKDLLGA